MQMVGDLQVGGANWDYDSFGKLIGRLTKEVEHTGDLTRYIGYRGVTSKQDDVQLFCIEVERIGAIPTGLLAWDMNGDAWTVLRPDCEKNATIWQDSLAWSWFDRSSSGRVTGEFTAKCPSEWNSNGVSVCRNFRVTTNAYIAPEKGGPDDDVHIVDYDPSWPRQFEDIAQWIQDELGTDVALHVEHYGSTSIPCMPAKPIIDVLVEVPSFAKARQRAIPLFNKPECEYWWYSDHMVFIMRNELMGWRTHHIHMAPAEHIIWKNLAFRDYLRAYRDEASRYAALKHKLAADYRTDRERYTIVKGQYVEEVMVRALQWSSGTRK